MRTSVWDIIQLAWVIYRNSTRRHLRIGQSISAACAADPGNGLGRIDTFYVENSELIQRVKGLK